MFNHLGTEEDREDMIRSVRLARDLFAQPVWNGIQGEEITPGAPEQSDAEILAWARRAIGTGYHPSGATRMSVQPEEAVVDAEARVHGLAVENGKSLAEAAGEIGFCADATRCFVDAGAPAGTVQVVHGVPSQVSEHLIASPIPRKVSLTGSTPVGKLLQRLAAETMKRCTMELGGHAPVIVFADADIPNAKERLVAAKFRNAGQVCTSPTQFYVQCEIYPRFVDALVERAKAVKVGNGAEPGGAARSSRCALRPKRQISPSAWFARVAATIASERSARSALAYAPRQ